jgi:hypothetical protein
MSLEVLISPEEKIDLVDHDAAAVVPAAHALSEPLDERMGNPPAQAIARGILISMPFWLLMVLMGFLVF